ncbi:hypothetical protein [Lysobacter sp. TAB13]|uniref:hypothetical protein n=1 Tax=Lysobacter sp. TAB13 TaxID=3233065 RepID=UPI003F98ACF5
MVILPKSRLGGGASRDRGVSFTSPWRCGRIGTRRSDTKEIEAIAAENEKQTPVSIRPGSIRGWIH